MSSVTTTKKTYNKNGYGKGKYYTYKRIRGLMSRYFRAKLSVSMNTETDQNLYKLKVSTDQNLLRKVALADLMVACPKASFYRSIFGFYKLRGILIEINPGPPPVRVAGDVNTYNGEVRLGISETDNDAFTVDEVAEMNMSLLFNHLQYQRKYFPFYIKDFTRVPINAQNVYSGMPYYIYIRQRDVLQLGNLPQAWNITVTFYVTYRQSMS